MVSWFPQIAVFALLYLLNNWTVCDAGQATKQAFYDQLTIMPTSEAIFLLTTFANMAGCRSHDEMDFAEIVTREIFEVVLDLPYNITESSIVS